MCLPGVDLDSIKGEFADSTGHAYHAVFPSHFRGGEGHSRGAGIAWGPDRCTRVPIV